MASKKEMTQAAREEFAHRLQSAMIKKGWTQVELARAANKQADDDTPIERYTISNYMRAIALPGPARLKALSDALGVEPEDLLPARVVPPAFRETRGAPTREFKDIGEGNVWLTINQSVPYEKALKIMEMLK